jgi:hypothetical protein
MAWTKEEKETRGKHEWERTWSALDFKSHDKELREIHKEWKELRMEYFKTGVFPDVLYQIRHGGLNKKGEAIHSEVIESEGGWQKYDENKFKIAKYQVWIEFSMTRDERVENHKKTGEFIKEMKNKMRGFGSMENHTKPPVQVGIDLAKCNLCDGTGKVTENAGFANEREVDCECKGVDDTDFSGSTEGDR